MSGSGKIPAIHIDPDKVARCAKCRRPMDIGYVSPDGSNWWCRTCLPEYRQQQISQMEKDE